MSHRKRHRSVRARGPSDDELFERALSGRDSTDTRNGQKADHKTMALCRQVQRSLSMALSGECRDDVLRELYVDAVDAPAGPAHLIVRVVVPSRAGISIAEVYQRLEDRQGLLRKLVAQSICRKRTPILTFVAVPEGGSHA